MKILIRNTLAVVIGLVLGSLVNMALVVIGPRLIPPPAGVDMSTVEGLNAGVHLLELPTGGHKAADLAQGERRRLPAHGCGLKAVPR